MVPLSHSSRAPLLGFLLLPPYAERAGEDSRPGSNLKSEANCSLTGKGLPLPGYVGMLPLISARGLGTCTEKPYNTDQQFMT